MLSKALTFRAVYFHVKGHALEFHIIHCKLRMSVKKISRFSFRKERLTMFYRGKILDCFSFVRSQDQQESIMQRCGLAEPHHGENWCAVSKAIPNWRLRTKDILPIVAKSLKPIEKE